MQFFSFISIKHSYQVFGCGWGYQRWECSGWGGDWVQRPGEDCTSWHSSSTAQRRPVLLALQLLPAFVYDLNTHKNTPRETSYVWKQRGRRSRASQRQVAENTHKTRDNELHCDQHFIAQCLKILFPLIFTAHFLIPFQMLIMIPRPHHLLYISLLWPRWCSGTRAECLS